MSTEFKCVFCSYEKMTELGIEPNGQRAFQVYCDFVHLHADQPSKDDFDDCYQGKFKSGGDYCKWLFLQGTESNMINDSVQRCIDWEEVWENFEDQYDYSFEQGYIFG